MRRARQTPTVAEYAEAGQRPAGGGRLAGVSHFVVVPVSSAVVAVADRWGDVMIRRWRAASDRRGESTEDRLASLGIVSQYGPAAARVLGTVAAVCVVVATAGGLLGSIPAGVGAGTVAYMAGGLALLASVQTRAARREAAAIRNTPGPGVS